MIDITKSQTDFETFIAEFLGQTLLFVIGQRSSSGGYYNEYIDIPWIVWQASRESISLELPQRQSLYASGYGDGYFVPSISGEGLEYDEVAEALRTAGIRIKGESE
ncbi:hypothetical protein HB991_13405 [Yersinia mollaretii]|uniref:Uncharacterized protein n=1 Tax=Yersinia mollaretii TaxID=33060 RepID=A0AA44I0K3_YERMO|nr:hypothetical protein [Yersinia mollaretii]NIL23502.1 hypothetical protein [Yersinia mollaretii]